MPTTHIHTCRDSSHYLLRVVPVSSPPAAQKRLLEKNGTTEAGGDPDSSGALLKCRSWLWRLQVEVREASPPSGRQKAAGGSQEKLILTRIIVRPVEYGTLNPIEANWTRQVKVLSVVDVHICDYVKGRATLNSSNIITVQVTYSSGHEPCWVFCPARQKPAFPW